MCLDMHEADKDISRERHLLPTLDEVIHDLNGATVFSKLDLNQGYHQLLLPLTQGTLPHSLFKRLSIGINAAAEKFQSVIASATSDIPNVNNITDDVIIYGVNVQQHDKAPHAVLNRFQELNLTLLKDKCQT